MSLSMGVRLFRGMVNGTQLGGGGLVNITLTLLRLHVVRAERMLVNC